eukprot:CAMPEP_0170527388 /NCGR_PEP_ID=MMETSP0209-20121228/12864_1 /TAXON_ID=665100 ORGANISM="Litonotus pictus, Strain P1" /NCGR_SAMPLE_ID=MMETSP0209 /ASSEMBLY_ACC=CAM_ASM_000301 /LENGTH=429 /DNA_ID=CAMNT_0010817877 /DNA_START=127 /DNA_END=1413 /DNA_ORIENTATION=-
MDKIYLYKNNNTLLSKYISSSEETLKEILQDTLANIESRAKDILGVKMKELENKVFQKFGTFKESLYKDTFEIESLEKSISESTVDNSVSSDVRSKISDVNSILENQNSLIDNFDTLVEVKISEDKLKQVNSVITNGLNEVFSKVNLAPCLLSLNTEKNSDKSDIPYEKAYFSYARFTQNNFGIYKLDNDQNTMLSHNFPNIEGYSIAPDYSTGIWHIVSANSYCLLDQQGKILPQPNVPYYKSYHSSVVAKGGLWLVGNWGENASGTLFFDFEKREWETKANMKSDRNSFALVHNEDHLYAIGGYFGWSQITDPNLMVERYSISEDKWESMNIDYGDFKGAVYLKGCAINSSEIMLLGGLDSRTGRTLKRSTIFDVDSCSFKSGSEFEELKEMSDADFYAIWVSNPFVSEDPETNERSIFYMAQSKQL